MLYQNIKDEEEKKMFMFGCEWWAGLIIIAGIYIILRIISGK